MYNSHPPERRLSRRMLLLALALTCSTAHRACAHEGPPFPILMDRPSAGYRVSVWADPDIGEALFYVIVEAPDGGWPDKVPEVSMWTEPTSGRLERVAYEAKKQKLKSHLQFELKPYFDQGDMWNVGFQIDRAGVVGELVAQVESTPPGYGLWDLAIYLFPFVLLGGMWMVAMVRRSRSDRRTKREYEEEQLLLDAQKSKSKLTGVSARE